MTQHVGFVRYFEDALRLLAERGHSIRVVYQEERLNELDTGPSDRLAVTCPTVTVEPAPVPEPGTWPAFARVVRILIDRVRYFDSRYRHAPVLRARVEREMPGWTDAARPVRLLGDRGVRLVLALLQRMDRVAPTSARVRRFVAEANPDLVFVTPLVELRSKQVDYVKAARSLGIPSAVGIVSWDHLTTKGHMRIVPDRIFVWNEAQKEEAHAFHGAPRARVVVTGAQIFDHWFDARPTRTREAFCTEVGLDPARPFLLYVASTGLRAELDGRHVSLAEAEMYFVETWIRAVRGANDPRVAEAGILIRPHPKGGFRYLGVDLSQLEGVVVWPPPTERRSLFSTEGREDFFDSLSHSAACVGVNTTALVDAAIVGRTVCTVRRPEFAFAQEGTLHFAHLTGERDGPLRIADDLDGHLRDLADVLAGGADDGDRTQAFVRTFVRPRGVDRAAAPILADEIEAAADLQVERVSTSTADRVLRVLLYPLAAAMARLPSRPAKPGAPALTPLVGPLAAFRVRSAVVGAAVWPLRSPRS